MRRQTLGWIAVACAVPFAFWLMAPADAEWVGTDDRMGEFAAPAGTRVFEAPEWSPAGENLLFLAQAGAGVVLLGGSLWKMKARGGRGD
jgi:hypothetical protein